ncbi:hypothetical protein BGZ49_000082 [Haplosporangium sp. Z 27]|nr:hypothetical protein BGZ49_000082 [Haplosporangium sp. Z 27]
MGNAKSRHAGGTQSKSRSKHSKLQSGGSSNSNSNSQDRRVHSGKNKNQVTLLNDSGHYSVHGFAVSPPSPIDRAETPVGITRADLAWNHPNLSSPGRLDQQNNVSDSSLHYQYGSNTQNNNTNNGNLYHSPHVLEAVGVRASGTGSRTTMMLGVSPGEENVSGAYGGGGYNQTQALNSNYINNNNNNNTIHNTLSSQEMTMSTHHQQPQPSYQGGDTRPSSASPRQSQGKISTFHHTPSSHTQTSQQQQMHQQHQYSMHTPVSPSTIPFIEDEQHPAAGLAGVVSSVANINLNDNRVPNNGATMQHQQIMRLQQQQQQQYHHQHQQQDDNQRITTMHPYLNANNNNGGGNRNSANLHPAYNNGAASGNIGNNTARNDPFKNNGQHYHYNELSQPIDQSQYQLQQQRFQQQQQQQQYQSGQPRLTTSYPTERPPMGGTVTNNIGNSASTKPVDVLASAGPLIEGGSGPRPPTSDQVFARLAKQFPTNPKETEKRERIYRWLDHMADALTFNPDTETPGWIIPVYPDELDHPERITYELDLMAPVGRPFRKAIDINCNNGEWAMDMAIKYPRTIVYALDPNLETTNLPLRIPENCKFRMRDVRDQEGEFDLVHQRLGAFKILIQEWTPHFAELRRLLRPGGWIQLAETNGQVVRAGVETLKVNRWVERAALSSGFNPMQMMEALMPTILGAGLINVECYDYGIPVGDWAGPRGHVAMRAYLEMVESLRDEIVEMNRLEEGIFEETIAAMKAECVAEKAELVFKVICAQKPPMTDDLWRTR